MKNRIEKIRQILIEKNLDSILITSKTNIYYLSGFSGSSAIVYITKNNAYIFSDFRYREQVKNECPDFTSIIIEQGSFSVNLNSIVLKENSKVIGFEGDDMSYNKYQVYTNNINAKFEPLSLTNIRICKDEKEIDYTKHAALIATDAYHHICKFIKVGMSEIEVEAEIAAFIKKRGATNSFDTIVASGVRGAQCHARASEKIIEKGDFVTLDFGARYKLYCSDITRTIVVGEVKNTKLKEIYEIVLEAQKRAVAAVKPGVLASDIDKIARDYITSFNYGADFGHGTGHGIGIDIHEAPSVSSRSKDVLEVGNIITVEPGIYIEGLGGIRIEDDILVTKDGYEILTKAAAKDLLIV